MNKTQLLTCYQALRTVQIHKDLGFDSTEVENAITACLQTLIPLCGDNAESELGITLVD